jgi:hypothetical protein
MKDLQNVKAFFESHATQSLKFNNKSAKQGNWN